MNIRQCRETLASTTSSFPTLCPFRKPYFLPRGCSCPRPTGAALAQPRNARAVPDRRDALVAAVAAYNRSHKPLPNSAVRLLEAMFASDDVCQQSLQALEDVAGISRKHIQVVLRDLLAAGLIAKEDTGAGRHANRYRLLLKTGDGA